jgi:nicotinamide riboside transporter PnuC
MLTAGVLSALAISTFAWRVTQTDPEETERLIGELRLAQWMAVLLAGIGGTSLGLAIAHAAVPLSNVDAFVSVIFLGLAGLVLQREAREGLLLAAGGFVLHALVDIAHRPGWLSTDLAPRWFTVGCAIYNVYLAAWCFWARRR